MKVSELDALPADQAAELLRSCCGSSRWVNAMVARRPHGTLPNLLATAAAAWRDTGPADWDEAFAQHPRIGESRPAAPVSEAARGWSAREQGGLDLADAAVRAALASGNREYERRFGRIFIVRAGGKSPEELLENLRSRLLNPPEDELRIAAGEQGKITMLRLGTLFSDEGATIR